MPIHKFFCTEIQYLDPITDPGMQLDEIKQLSS